MRVISFKTARPAVWILACLAGALAVQAQTDPLVSKSLPLVLGDAEYVWAFDDLGQSYSRVHVFDVPVSVHNGKLPFKDGIQGGFGRGSSLLLFFNYTHASDSVTVGGVASLNRGDNVVSDSMSFSRTDGKPANVTLSTLAAFHDTLAIGFGRAGFALTKLKPEGQAPLAGDTLALWTLPKGSDTAVNLLACVSGKSCKVDTLDQAIQNLGDANSVTLLAVDSAAADTAWLLIGTPSGLRRGLLGQSIFPKITLPAPGGDSLSIKNIYVDSRNAILWVFTGDKVFFSDDHGQSFRIPPDPVNVASHPSQFTGFNPAPEAVNSGDTTFINFNFNQPFRPGLVLFRHDTVLTNVGQGDTANHTPGGDVIVDREDGLDIDSLQGRLTSLALVKNGNVSALVAGSTKKGLYYRKFGPGQDTAWVNLNRLKQVKGNLEEVITFPTVFPDDRGTEFINIGYRLKKDGRVTITVYNYAMEKVRVVVSGKPRHGGVARSENPGEDHWDGKDSGGRFVSVGVYYVLVESDKSEKGWGKAIIVRGRGR